MVRELIPLNEHRLTMFVIAEDCSSNLRTCNVIARTAQNLLNPTWCPHSQLWQRVQGSRFIYMIIIYRLSIYIYIYIYTNYGSKDKNFYNSELNLQLSIYIYNKTHHHSSKRNRRNVPDFQNTYGKGKEQMKNTPSNGPSYAKHLPTATLRRSAIYASQKS